MKTAAVVARVVLGTALVAGMLLGGCEGNVNDDDVPVLPIDLVSYNEAGSFAKGSCYSPSVSRDGRYMTFDTHAPGMHPLDTNSLNDVFVRDLVERKTILVSVNALWTNGGNGRSENARIDPEGRFVAFLSMATDLVNVTGFSDSNYEPDIYVHDLQNGVTMPVSVNSVGTGMAGVDWYCFPDLIQFDNDSDGTPDELYVVFQSAGNVLGDGARYTQIYVRKMSIQDFEWPLNLSKIQNGKTHRISKDSFTDIPADDDWGNSNSGNPVLATCSWNSNYLLVAWESYASDLLGDPATTDTNGKCDIFARAFLRGDPSSNLGETIMISREASGSQGGNGHSTLPVISEDGNYVAFVSEATDLMPALDFNGQKDIYLFGPLSSGPPAMERISEGTLGQANGASLTAGISADGRYVLFSSDASNLVEGDTNDSTDVFLKDRDSGTLSRVSLTVFGGELSGDSGYLYDVGGADLSGDGRTVVFQSRSNNILPGITFFEGQQLYRRKY